MQPKGRSYYLTVFDGETGKVKWIRLGSSYGEALAKYAELEGYNPGGRKVSDLIDRFVRDHVPTLAEDTRREYKRSAGVLREVFGTLQLADVKKSHVSRYLDEHPKAAQANHDIALLSSMFSKAIRWGWHEGENPCRHVPRNSLKKKTRLMTHAELDALRLAANPQMRLAIELSYLTALRKRDIIRIRLSDISAEGLSVRTSKTGDPILFSAGARLDDVLARARGLRRKVGSMFLFANRNGQPYTPSGFDSIFQRTRRKAGVEGVSFHDIRALRITEAAEARGKEFAQALATHASIVTTERYIRGRQVPVIELGF